MLQYLHPAVSLSLSELSLNCTWTNPLDNMVPPGSISVLAPTPILSLEGRKELATSRWTSLAQGWSFMCTISWWMPILLGKAIVCPVFEHPPPCPVLAGVFVTCSAPRGQCHGQVQGSESCCESDGLGGAPCHGREK